MARIVRFHETGGPEVLRLEQVLERDPGPGEVRRIKVEAIGLNRAEIMLREGVYHERPIFPSRIGYEAAGVVGAVGASVTTVKEGERVATVPSFSLSQTRQGVYGESALHPGETVYPLMPMLAKSLTIIGYQLLVFVLDPERFSVTRDYIFAGLNSGALAPVIDRTFPLEQIVEAHQHMESNTQCGKIVVTV
jgi:NADPH:quinone reductase-like Zn-dependent oxidoreductase